MPTIKKENDKQAWSDDHTLAMLRATIAAVLAHRSSIYSQPALSGVADNGGDRINKKLQQALKKLCEAYPGVNGLVEEEVKALKASKNGGVAQEEEGEG